MEVTEADVARIPPGNLRVSREDFAAVWRTAVEQDEEQARRGISDWYAGGVAVTCQWMATAPARSTSGPGRLTRSPATRRSRVAYEELIEQEFLAAERLDQTRPDLIEARPGWCEAVRATLRWAWRRQGPPPLEVAARAAG